MSSTQQNDASVPAPDGHPAGKAEGSEKTKWEVRANKWVVASSVAAVVAVLVPVVFSWLDDQDTPAPPTSALPSSSAIVRPKCDVGAVCLWEDQNFMGTPWKWTPGKDPDGPLPPHLQDHVGSFDSQVEFDEKNKRGACFVDTATGEAHPARERDYGSTYLSRFGSKMDAVRRQC